LTNRTTSIAFSFLRLGIGGILRLMLVLYLIFGRHGV
jgi:hypothetical protein